MSERHQLAEATAVLHAMATAGIRIDDRKFEQCVLTVLADYDRRGAELKRLRAIEAAAVTTDEQWRRFAAWAEDVRRAMPTMAGVLDTLSSAVRDLDGKEGEGR